MLNLTDSQNQKIIKALARHNIKASKLSLGTIQVNRTECHNAIRKHEWEIIDILHDIIKDEVDKDKYYVCHGMKTDDIWTWEIYKKG